MKKPNQLFQSPVVAIVVAFLATMLLLHDVAFMGRSLLPADYTNVLSDETETRQPGVLWHVGNSRSVTFRRHDIGAGAWQFEPSLHFMTRALHEGETPYWNPNVATGGLGPETLADMKFSFVSVATALLGGSSEAFHLVFFVLVFFSCYSVIRISACYFGQTGAGVIATVAAFLLGGYAQVNLIAPFLILLYFTTPIVLHSLLALARMQNAGRLCLATAAHVLLFSLSFTPVMILATGFVHAVCLTFIVAEIDPARRARAIGLADLATPLIALLLLAPLYLPTIASFSDTITLEFYLKRESQGFALADAPHLLLGVGYRQPDMPNIGAIPALLAVAGLTSSGPHRAVRYALGAAGLVGLFVAFRIWPASLLDSVPILRSIALGYWAFLYCIPIPFLAGFGVTAVVARKWWALPVALIAAIAVLAFAVNFVTDSEGARHSQHVAFGIVAALLCAAIIFLTLARSRPLARIAGWTLVILAVADGLFATNFMRPPRLNKGAEPPAAIAFVRDALSNAQNGRVLNVGRDSLYPDWAAALGIAQVGTMNMSELRWFAPFYRKHVGNEWRFLSLGRTKEYIPILSDAALDLLGVRYVIVDTDQAGTLARIEELNYPLVREDGTRAVYENAGALPRAFVAGALLEATDLPSRLGFANNEVATTTDSALLRRAKQLGIPRNPTAPAGTAVITEYFNGRLKLDVEMKEPGVLVVTDAWHPSWNATVDGRDGHVGRVDEAFRGIVLPAGKHIIEMAYSPRLFSASLALSGLGSLLLAALSAVLFGQANCSRHFLYRSQ